ncbi:reverse transcriptase [Tanacetum coccineum]|uniref:Reverse transcriptase n=1 Tax=Tanacetum coccineum TaxID=301880 RepID=A0ABQ5CZ36_9ASTR
MVSTRMDDATKQFINEAIQEAITAAMTAIQQRIDGVCLRQETLATEMQNQNNGQLVGGNAANRVNGYGRLTKRQWPRSNVGRYSEEFLEDFGAVCEGSNGKFKELRKHYNSRMFKPRLNYKTYCLVHMQEVANESRTKSNQYIQVIEMLLALVLVVMVEVIKKEYEEKRAKNQCFYRDQKYVPGHKCMGQMFVLEVLATPDEEGEELIREECLAEEIKGVNSSNIKPYRYPPIQKDTIEAMVKELLDSGMIRQSNSAFSSPIVMVKNVADRVLHLFPCLPLLLHRATSSFHALQQAMVQSLVLALPNFEKEFIIETDASGYGVGAVLQ